MNTDNDHRSDDRFDAAMRQRHALASARISPRVEAQLRQRRAALRADPRRAHSGWRPGWPVATACAAVLAVLAGTQLQREPASQTPAPAAMAAAAAAADRADLDSVLDENPDFYLWLASGDADTFAVK